MIYNLRPRQQIAVEKIEDFINNSKTNHGIFVYPTGFGKSLIISTLAQKFPDRYFINVTASKELVLQNFEKYKSYGFEATICSSSLKSQEVSHVTFATIGTLIKFANYFKDKKTVIVYDEAHTASAKGSQIDMFVKQLKDYRLVGVTATPFRLSNGMTGTSLKMMNRDRDCIYKSINDVVQISEVVEQNYWSKLIYDIKDVDETDLVLNTTGSDFTDKSLEKFKETNDINSKIIYEVNNLILEGRKSILVSVPFIADAKEIADKIDGSKALFSGMDNNDRDKIINDFKTLKLKVVIQVKILTIGFDHPQLDAIVTAKPSNSLTFYYQLLGRGVRIHPKKTDCKIVDLSGNCKKFGSIETITIEDEKLTGGWAVFNGDMLLSNYPLNTTNRPTKQSLLAQLKWQEEVKENKSKLNEVDVKFHFGKYKDKKVSEVMKENKSYLTWLLDQKKFNWFGENGRKLKQSIQKYLGVFLEEEKAIIAKPIPYKAIQNEFKNFAELQKDLVNIW
jgi:DNA repair protein RadD